MTRAIEQLLADVVVAALDEYPRLTNVMRRQHQAQLGFVLGAALGAYLEGHVNGRCHACGGQIERGRCGFCEARMPPAA